MVGAYGVGGTEAETLKGGLQHTWESTRNLNKTTESPLGTVRGFFAGLKKRQGITVDIAERIRQVGPNKQGAKGSYTVYRVAE